MNFLSLLLPFRGPGPGVAIEVEKVLTGSFYFFSISRDLPGYYGRCWGRGSWRSHLKLLSSSSPSNRSDRKIIMNFSSSTNLGFFGVFEDLRDLFSIFVLVSWHVGGRVPERDWGSRRPPVRRNLLLLPDWLPDPGETVSSLLTLNTFTSLLIPLESLARLN